MSSRERVVLDVGQCGFDHGNIARMLEEAFSARVEAAATADEALDLLAANTYDLILVNRILSGDGTEGVDLIRQIKTDANTRQVPVMLVSNFEDAQQEAKAAGAEPGFGKSDLESPDTRASLDRHLGSSAQ